MKNVRTGRRWIQEMLRWQQLIEYGYGNKMHMQQATIMSRERWKLINQRSCLTPDDIDSADEFEQKEWG